MGRQPRSGDIPWLSAHSILNWIGGDMSMLVLFWLKSSAMCRNLRRALTMPTPRSYVPFFAAGSTAPLALDPFWESSLRRPNYGLEIDFLRVDINSSGR